MCPLPICSWPLLWWPLYLHGLGTATVSMWSEGAKLSRCSPLSSPLMQLHVGMLKLNPNAGQRPPYEMHGAQLRRVK